MDIPPRVSLGHPAQHYPNNRPPDLSRRYNRQAIIVGHAHKKTPDAMAGGKCRSVTGMEEKTRAITAAPGSGTG